MNPLHLQGLADGASGALQHLVLLNLAIEHYLQRDGGLGQPQDLIIQPCAKTSRMGLSVKENKPNGGARPVGLTLGLLLPALDLDTRGLGCPGSLLLQFCVATRSQVSNA